jgi:hypothetical protein
MPQQRAYNLLPPTIVNLADLDLEFDGPIDEECCRIVSTQIRNPANRHKIPAEACTEPQTIVSKISGN